MATAARAPSLRESERVDVTVHALEKLRERLPLGSHYLSMPDQDLKLRIEEGWKHSVSEKTMQEWWERGSEGAILCNFVVDLSSIFETGLFGLFREDDRQPGRPVCITVLAKHMVETNKAQGRWAKTPEEIGERKALTSAPFRGPLANAKPAPPVPAPVVQPANSEPSSDIMDLEKILVVYQHPETQDELFVVTSRGRLQGILQELVDKGVAESSFQFWSRRPVYVRKRIEVGF